ncbi:hypothetical protein A8B75_19185 [Sphingomonadales bacterium EhC05]|nr:hypothetical protein A8B75_19185 [Sphingomonadales bacterium EhC05]
MLNLMACANVPATTQKSVNAVLRRRQSQSWSSQANSVLSFKSVIMAHGLAVQDSRCVWCTLKISEEGHRTAHRDHIAPKGQYNQWTFLPVNLAIACEYCNGFKVKGELNTVSVPADQYNHSEFLIVHPYLDDTNNHIRFVDNTAGYPILIEGISERGVWTIEKMALASPYITKLRAQDFVFARETEALAAGELELLKRAVDRHT